MSVFEKKRPAKTGDQEEVMNSVLSFLSSSMNAIIVIGGIVLLVLLIGNYASLNSHYRQIKAVLSWKNTKSVINKTTHEIEDKDESEKVTPDTIRV